MPTGIWQRNYYEHIIRDEKDLQNKTDYIEAIPPCGMMTRTTQLIQCNS